jgi:hypothetical protein
MGQFPAMAGNPWIKGAGSREAGREKESGTPVRPA